MLSHQPTSDPCQQPLRRGGRAALTWTPHPPPSAFSGTGRLTTVAAGSVAPPPPNACTLTPPPPYGPPPSRGDQRRRGGGADGYEGEAGGGGGVCSHSSLRWVSLFSSMGVVGMSAYDSSTSTSAWLALPSMQHTHTRVVQHVNNSDALTK